MGKRGRKRKNGFGSMGMPDVRDVLGMVWRYRGYLPTALRTWRVLGRADFKPWSQREKSHGKNTSMFPHSAASDTPFDNPREKRELLRRAEWLCREVIVDDPEELIAKMPEAIGRAYQGQWAIYACSMTTCALCNLIRLYPELREKYLPKVAILIEQTDTPEIRAYDTDWWKEDAMESLDGNSSHMTYLSILAWMIGNFRLAGGDGRYDALHRRLCDTLQRRMLAVPDLNLPSFPNGIIFLPDMMFVGMAFKDYDTIHGKVGHSRGLYAATLAKWVEELKSRYIDPNTGLLASSVHRNLTTGRTSGAYAGLNALGAAYVDTEFGRRQLARLKEHMVTAYGSRAAVREYLRKAPKYTFDIDAGPVVYGISPSGTSFAIGAATYLGDWELRDRLLATASLAGGNARTRRTQHYRLADIMLTGEAITLAMRTMTRFPAHMPEA